MLDDVLAREIQKFVGTGNPPESRAPVNTTLREVAKDMERITRYDDSPLYECLKKYGRAAVAICIAATLYERRERLGNWGLRWALEVLGTWPWRNTNFICNGLIGGNSHPTAICTWAQSFMKLNWI